MSHPEQQIYLSFCSRLFFAVDRTGMRVLASLTEQRLIDQALSLYCARPPLPVVNLQLNKFRRSPVLLTEWVCAS
jgi:hypothetical protein